MAANTPNYPRRMRRIRCKDSEVRFLRYNVAANKTGALAMISASERATPPLVREAILVQAKIGILGRILRANAIGDGRVWLLMDVRDAR